MKKWIFILLWLLSIIIGTQYAIEFTADRLESVRRMECDALREVKP